MYAAETRSYDLRAELAGREIGLVVQRGRVRKAAIGLWPRWFHDCLSWGDFCAGRDFDDGAELQDVRDMLDGPRPDFAVLPDRVGAAAASLATSAAWWARVGRLPIAWALAVQDGMTPAALPWDEPFEVVFVGGTTRWKLETAGAWVEAAHAHGRRVHIGRVGSARRVRWARGIGADSIDTAVMLWGERNLRPFLAALDETAQAAFAWAAPRLNAPAGALRK